MHWSKRTRLTSCDILTNKANCQKKLFFGAQFFHFVEVAPVVATIVPVAATMVPVLAHVVIPMAAISATIIAVRAIQNMASKYEYPYTYLCLAIYYINLQNFLCMIKIWKLYEGIHIYVLRITFNHCGFWLISYCILQKVIFILVWNTYRK